MDFKLIRLCEVSITVQDMLTGSIGEFFTRVEKRLNDMDGFVGIKSIVVEVGTPPQIKCYFRMAEREKLSKIIIKDDEKRGTTSNR